MSPRACNIETFVYIDCIHIHTYIQLDYTLVEIDEDKLVDSKTNRSLDISPMQLIRPADIKEGDQIYVIQHPRGEQLAFSSSDSIVLGK